MVIFPIIIVVSAVLWVYYKVQILRERDGLVQAYFNARSRICLGSVVFFFAINQYLFYQTRLSLFIGIVFLLLGGMQLVRGFREVKHYKREWQRVRAD
ncbi:YtpI family protein [Lentibacillus sediminis]|uniref:YtpI family protein n=1 Tax=Lentibacillus sediminis TaxID=1940529 RepID=UPI000C1C54DB|nr:YtpI family protein [Lentibacillus sediminis]